MEVVRPTEGFWKDGHPRRRLFGKGEPTGDVRPMPSHLEKLLASLGPEYEGQLESAAEVMALLRALENLARRIEGEDDMLTIVELLRDLRQRAETLAQRIPELEARLTAAARTLETHKGHQARVASGGDAE